MKVVAPLMLLLLFKEGEGCTTTLNDLCVSETGAQTFSFSLSVPSVGLVQFEVSKENSAALLLFDYNAGSIIAPSIRLNSDVTFTGDYSTGDVSFVLNNVTISESGTYRLRNKGTSEDLQCLTLFVQATGAGAINATLSTESNSVAVGGTITFSCVAATKTSPPGIAFAYTWQVNSAPVTNANDSRYSFSENKFTINNVTTSDDNDQSVTCRATEPLCGTKTSDPSNSIKIEVTGKPAECEKCFCRVICYVGVFVNIPVAIVILILYCIIICFKKWILVKMGSIAFCCIIILPALCSMALGIGLVVGLCVRNCKECAETECADSDDDSYLVLDTVLGVVLVIICNPCCSFGILIHWKCFGGKTATDCNKLDHDDHDLYAGIKMQSKDAGNRHVNAGGQGTGRSCFEKKNAILPICSGQDEGRQRGPRHGHSEGNWPRPQPAGGESSQPHDGPKNKETPLKPRKLPEIPTTDNKSRGLSANFDEVLPEKKRLTPLGQEATDSYEERPRKKKKKKKKNEADDESEY